MKILALDLGKFNSVCCFFNSETRNAKFAVVASDRCGVLSAERTKQQLRRCCTTDYDLAAKVNRNRDRSLYDAALHQFGW